MNSMVIFHGQLLVITRWYVSFDNTVYQTPDIYWMYSISGANFMLDVKRHVFPIPKETPSGLSKQITGNMAIFSLCSGYARRHSMPLAGNVRFGGWSMRYFGNYMKLSK